MKYVIIINDFSINSCYLSNMKGFTGDIEKITLENDFFRKVIFTSDNLQLVVMSLLPGEDIGEEVHENVDQFFRLEEGEGKIIMDGQETEVEEDDVIIVPKGTRHNLINTSSHDHLKLYTIYSPPNHKDGTIHKTKEETVEA